MAFFSFLSSHVGFIIVTDLLDAHVVLRVDEGLGCGVGLREGHDTGDILEVVLIVNFDLERQRQEVYYETAPR